MTTWEILARTGLGAVIMAAIAILWAVLKDEVSSALALLLAFVCLALSLCIAFGVGYFALFLMGVT